MTIRGRVAKVLSSRDLVLNIGAKDGVRSGMEFHVVDKIVAIDPVSKKQLAPIEVLKARVMVNEVVENACVASTFRRQTPGATVSETLSRLFDQPEKMIIDLDIEKDPAWSRIVQVGDTVVQFLDE